MGLGAWAYGHWRSEHHVFRLPRNSVSWLQAPKFLALGQSGTPEASRTSELGSSRLQQPAGGRCCGLEGRGTFGVCNEYRNTQGQLSRGLDWLCSILAGLSASPQRARRLSSRSFQRALLSMRLSACRQCSSASRTMKFTRVGETPSSLAMSFCVRPCSLYISKA